MLALYSLDQSSFNAALIALNTNLITRLLSYYNAILFDFHCGKESFLHTRLKVFFEKSLFMSNYDLLLILDAVFFIWCWIYLDGLEVVSLRRQMLKRVKTLSWNLEKFFIKKYLKWLFILNRGRRKYLEKHFRFYF